MAPDVWFGDLQIGDYVLPILDSKVDRLWRVRNFGTRKNPQGQDMKTAEFDVVKSYDPAVWFGEFNSCSYFEMDLNLLNKSAKSLRNLGFVPIALTNDCPPFDQIDAQQSRRKVVIGFDGAFKDAFKQHDVFIILDDINNVNIVDIRIFQGDAFVHYDLLWNLYEQKNPRGERYSIRRLLEYAEQDEAPNKRAYLANLLDALGNEGYYAANKLVPLYDNLIVGRRVTPKIEAVAKPEITIGKGKDETEGGEDETETGLSDQWQKFVDLLKFNPNIILYGPPGTGKTYSAEKIVEAFEQDATQVNFSYKKIAQEGRVKFATFHQAFSYEEFVEGIRPVMREADDEQGGGSIQYAVEDGVIKRIAKEAAGAQLRASATSTTNSALSLVTESSRIWKVSLGEHKKYYTYCKSKDIIGISFGLSNDLTGLEAPELCNLLNNKVGTETNQTAAAFIISHLTVDMQPGDFVLVYDSPRTISDIGIVTGDYMYKPKDAVLMHQRPVKWIKECGDKPIDIYEMNGYKRLTLSTIYELPRLNIADIKKLVLEEGEKTAELNPKTRPYYLIIDEINRGNVASIFGELMTLLEKDKRGKLSCILPYSRKPFTLPDNLYIIGTMNTADRSIALIDTALRRRFVFIEVEPDADIFDNALVENPRMVGMIDKKQLMLTLNERISKEIGRDYRIGHSYYMNGTTLDKFYLVWYYNLLPLLMEYCYSDIDRLHRLIGTSFIEKNGSLIFIDMTKSGDMSLFEQAIIAIYESTGK